MANFGAFGPANPGPGQTDQPWTPQYGVAGGWHPPGVDPSQTPPQAGPSGIVSPLWTRAYAQAHPGWNPNAPAQDIRPPGMIGPPLINPGSPPNPFHPPGPSPITPQPQPAFGDWRSRYAAAHPWGSQPAAPTQMGPMPGWGGQPLTQGPASLGGMWQKPSYGSAPGTMGAIPSMPTRNGPNYMGGMQGTTGGNMWAGGSPTFNERPQQARPSTLGSIMGQFGGGGYRNRSNF